MSLSFIEVQTDYTVESLKAYLMSCKLRVQKIHEELHDEFTAINIEYKLDSSHSLSTYAFGTEDLTRYKKNYNAYLSSLFALNTIPTQAHSLLNEIDKIEKSDLPFFENLDQEKFRVIARERIKTAIYEATSNCFINHFSSH